MTVQLANPRSLPDENWDDDFELDRNAHGEDSTALAHDDEDTRIRKSTSTAQSDWDAPQECAVAGPSTPTRVKRPPAQDNWDEDFEDSPVRGPRRRSTPRKAPSSVRHLESWDDDFEDAPPSNHVTPKRRRPTQTLNSSDEDEFGAAPEEEDRTVTARVRRMPLAKASPPPPVPPLPDGTRSGSVFPPPQRSPANSVFSIPPRPPSTTTTHYGSTTHLTHPHLRPTSGGLGNLPPSPPIHHQRRRLRKKSRPQPPSYRHQVLNDESDDGQFEQDEEADGDAQADPQQRELVRTPPPPASAPPSLPSSPPTPNTLLQRIGSVKKWGVRKKRASTGPEEALRDDRDDTPRAHSESQERGWFFRGSPGGAADDVAQMMAGGGSGSGSPTKAAESPTKPGRRRSLLFGRASKGEDSSNANASRTSLGAGVPCSRQTSSSYSHHADDEGHGRREEREGSRGFIGSVRRISLVGSGQRKHRRTKSSVGSEGMPPGHPQASDAEESPRLLPPIELHPLMPPIELHSPSGATTEAHVDALINASPEQPTGRHRSPSYAEVVATSPGSAPASTSTSTHPPPPPPPTTPPRQVLIPVSPQSASLGRAQGEKDKHAAVDKEKSTPRRNSLGDLKIPARISQAQVGLRRDLGLVREFAASVEQLKELQTTYYSLVVEMQTILEAQHVDAQDQTSGQSSTSRATSPTFFNLSRPGSRSRARSSTNPPPHLPVPPHKQLAAAFHTINSKYQISWECAELLIELGGGTPAPQPPAVNASASAPAVSGKGRERAITLAGDESKPPHLPPQAAPPPQQQQQQHPSGPPIASPPPNLAWRASTGRHDLSSRQLVLLREMLNGSGDDDAIPEDAGSTINRQWRWGDSTVSFALPSEDSGQASPTKKKRRASRIGMGMSGLRDMLRSLKRDRTALEQLPPPPTSFSASASTDSSLDSHGQRVTSPPPFLSAQRRRAKTSTGPESVRSAHGNGDAVYNTAASVSSFTHKASPRRPSLASIFRFSQKTKPGSAEAQTGTGTVHESSSSNTEEEDWDRIDSSSDLDLAARALGIGDGSSTVKGRKGRSPYLQDPRQRPVTPSRRAPSASQSSIFGRPDSPHARATRLSNVEENASMDDDGSGGKGAKGKHRSLQPPRPQRSAMAGKSGSVRSAPPQMFQTVDPGKLAMTPDNIRPLLENAKEVQARLNDCIGEIRTLLAARA
ncbi:hypothetical protein PLICRDRAFT_126750 [Plicaturopsis crispa FD-325 SS-3]|uniref:Uncharacterized protein n=1 Tax=Plicaturopsis crispa FD-325 SS-3 TaxID=944288 RepID=A0A0C9SYD1_PLICR|nr:hypothetical protein PLICRDRAFT_126750 [Plicaturopsis crispa FD-325 SS-3]